MDREEFVPASLTPLKDLFMPGHWLVHVNRTSLDEFVIYVDKNYSRRFLLKDLPNEIKEKLVLIHSVENNVIDEEGTPPELLFDIGWRLTYRNWYQFVMSNDLLNELKGSVLTNTVNTPA